MQWCSFCCCFPALIKCQRQSQKTKQLERKMCSQNPNTDDFNCQRRHKKEQVKWVTPSFSLLILSQAWLTSCDEKGDTWENRPRRMLTWKIHINPLVCECWQSLRLLETIHVQLLHICGKQNSTRTEDTDAQMDFCITQLPKYILSSKWLKVKNYPSMFFLNTYTEQVNLGIFSWFSDVPLTFSF